MPCNYAEYHPDWKNISRQIKEQAGWKCEFCNAPHNVVIVRTKGSDQWRHLTDGEYLYGDDHGKDGRVTKVILTVAHLDHVKANNDPANLRALCQRCHLIWDMEHHVINAANTRRQNRIDAGQAVLL